MLNRKLILIGAIILLFASVLNFNINPAHAGGSSTIFAQQLFVPDDVVVGSPTINYQDPEFLPGGSQMVFQDANRDVWIANLNLQTGLLRSTTGLDIAVDQAISEISTTANGPEWGVDSSGVSVFYTKPDINGINQIWRATLRGSLVTKRKLIERPQGAYGSLTSQDDTASTVKVAYGVGSIGSGSVLAWSDETIPTQAIVVPDYSRNSAGARWLPGGQDFTYSRISSELPLRSQIVRYRTANQSIEVIAEENGTISDVWGFLAPEFNNELLYVATINHQQVYVYRFINGNWTRFASLKLPSEATQRFIYSLEPVQGLRGF
ncbi:MAG: hypothetical protein JNN15_18160, partial [Blastocatellia bacterium]|nr:hypothetical protein [Blastocatellia bacterium]